MEDDIEGYGAFDEGGLGGSKTSSPEEPKTSSVEEDETLSEIETKNSMTEARGEGSELGTRQVTYELFGSETFRTPPEEAEDKVKVGFTFRKSVKDRLDKFCAAMNVGDGPSAAKSEVAEAAVDLFLRGWELLGRSSFVIKWLRERVNGS